MVRDLDKESRKIKNGNRYVLEESGSGVFARDYDRLYLEYTNLRKKIYSKYKDSFSTQSTRDELASYIDEQFIKLVKEYEINSPVDFPGYIKKKLNLRVKKSFINGKFKDMDREFLTKEENGVGEMLEEDAYTIELSVEDLDLRKYVFDGLALNPIERSIVSDWLTERYTNTEVARRVAKKHLVPRQEVEDVMSGLRAAVRARILKYNKEK